MRVPIGGRVGFEALLEQVGGPALTFVFPALGHDGGEPHGSPASKSVGSKRVTLRPPERRVIYAALGVASTRVARR